MKRVLAHRVLGVVGEGGEPGGLELGAIDEAEQTMAAGSHDPHELEGEAAHGVARINLHHGLEPGAFGGLTDQGVDADGSPEADCGQPRFERRGDDFVHAPQESRRIWPGVEGPHRPGWRTSLKARARPIGQELSAVVVEEVGEADAPQSAGGAFELHREIDQAFEPRFHHQGLTGLEGISHPPALGFQEFRFPKSDGIGPGQSEGLLDDQAVMALVSEGLDGSERRGQVRDRQSNRFDRAQRRKDHREFRVDFSQKLRTPGLGIQLGDAGVEAVVGAPVFAGHLREQRAQAFQAIRGPGPGAQTAEFAFADQIGEPMAEPVIVLIAVPIAPSNALRGHHELGQLEASRFQGRQKVRSRSLGHHHHVVAAGQELRQEGQVAGQLAGLGSWRESGPASDVSLGQRVEEEDLRRAPLGAGEEIQLRDELRLKTGRAAGFFVELDAFGPLRRQRKAQGAAERVPIAGVRILPLAEPLQSVGHVPDLVVQDAAQQGGRLEVTRLGKPPRKDAGEIEIGLLEGEAQPGDEVHRLAHRRHRSPEIAAHGQLAEGDAAGLHAVEVEAHVFLLLAQGVQDTPTKGRGRVGEAQERQGHQFGGQEFVIGEEVQDLAATCFVTQAVQAGELGLAGGARLVGAR